MGNSKHLLYMVFIPTDYFNNNNNNNHIAPYGRNFRGAGGRSDQCSVIA